MSDSVLVSISDGWTTGPCSGAQQLCQLHAGVWAAMLRVLRVLDGRARDGEVELKETCHRSLPIPGRQEICRFRAAEIACHMSVSELLIIHNIGISCHSHGMGRGFDRAALAQGQRKTGHVIRQGFTRPRARNERAEYATPMLSANLNGVRTCTHPFSSNRALRITLQTISVTVAVATLRRADPLCDVLSDL